MDIQSVTDVFTPTKPARLTFVDREALNDRLFDALRTPGKQLIVYGHTGSGKTTLLLNKLDQSHEGHVTTRCTAQSTFEGLVLDAFDEVGGFYDAQELHKRGKQSSAQLGADYFGIKAQIGSVRSSEAQITLERVLPPRLTPQRLAQFVGEANMCWVIEDFHKIADEEKIKLSQAMKIFMDMADAYPAVKIIAIGAVGTAREVVSYDREMQNRVAEINVPLMSKEEIRSILEKGQQILNISIPKNVLIDIETYAGGLPSVCHQLALNSCFSASVNETQRQKTAITSVNFEAALLSFVSSQSDTMKSALDVALKPQRKQKYDNCRLILEAISDCADEEGISRTDILMRIRQKHPDYPQGNLTNYLSQLISDERGAIIWRDESSGKYSYSNQFVSVFAKGLFVQLKQKEQQIEIPENIEWEMYLPSVSLPTGTIRNIFEKLSYSGVTFRIVSGDQSSFKSS